MSDKPAAVGLALKAPFYFRELVQQEDEFERAVNLCLGKKMGSRKCISTNNFEFVSRSALERRLKVVRSKKESYSRYWFMDKRRLLTLDEEASLADYVGECGDRDQALTKVKLSDKVVEILTLRLLKNREGGRRVVPVCPKGRGAIANGAVSEDWVENFYKIHDELKQVVRRDEDAARYEAACEPTVFEHFHGEFGLRRELLSAGIMDKDGLIVDKRRVVNFDECPNFLDYAQNKGNTKLRVGVRKGAKVTMSVTHDYHLIPLALCLVYAFS